MCFTQSGGIEVARTEERMQELQRRMSSAKAWGIDDVSIVTPAEVKELVPFIDESVIIGGFYTESVGIVDSLRFGTILRERAIDAGALSVFANTEVLGIDVEHGRIAGIRTSRGDIATEIVVVCCGVWSPKIARMAGASIPLTPAVHQMIDIGPVPHFKDTKGTIEFPIVRDMDTNMYERQDGSGLEIGSYAHRPILHDPEEIPSNEEAALSPTEFPFTEKDFQQQMEDALELIPDRTERRVRGHQVRDQRHPLADSRRPAAARGDARGEGSLVGGRGMGQGRARRRQGGCRVDDERRVGDRSSVVRRRALLRVPAFEGACEGPCRRGVQQDLWDRASRRAVGVEPPRAALAVLRA